MPVRLQGFSLIDACEVTGLFFDKDDCSGTGLSLCQGDTKRGCHFAYVTFVQAICQMSFCPYNFLFCVFVVEALYLTFLLVF